MSQHQVRVEHYQRVTSNGEDNQWLLQILGAGQTLVLDALECRLAVDEFYLKASGAGSEEAR